MRYYKPRTKDNFKEIPKRELGFQEEQIQDNLSYGVFVLSVSLAIGLEIGEYCAD